MGQASGFPGSPASMCFCRTSILILLQAFISKSPCELMHQRVHPEKEPGTYLALLEVTDFVTGPKLLLGSCRRCRQHHQCASTLAADHVRGQSAVPLLDPLHLQELRRKGL